MITCTECGREINAGQKRCNYCNSQIIKITASKILNKTKKASSHAIEKTAKTSSLFYNKAADNFKNLQEKKQEKSIKNTQKKINKLQQKLENKKETSKSLEE